METSPDLKKGQRRMSLNLRNLDSNTHRAYKAILTGDNLGKNYYK
jgi:hypothetical protein